MQSSLSAPASTYTAPQLERADLWQPPPAQVEVPLSNHTASDLKAALFQQNVIFQDQEVFQIQTLVEKVCTQGTYFFSKKKQLPLLLGTGMPVHSMTIRSTSDKKTAFLALDKRVYPVEKRALNKAGITIKNALMLEFSSDNKLLSTKRVVKMCAEYGQRNMKWFEQITRRLSIMQKVATCPYFPQNFAYIERPGRWRRKVEVYQEAADFDLHSFFEMKPGLDGLRIEQKLSLAKDLLLALKYLHEQRVCHFDLKLENVLLFRTSEGAYCLKLTDLGLARSFDDEQFRYPGGTTMWAAPEVIFDEKVTQNSDLWGLGHVLFVIQNVGPHYALSFLAGIDEIPELKSCRLRDYLHLVVNQMNQPPETIEDLTDIANAMLLKDPDARMSLDIALTHIDSFEKNLKN